MLMCMSKVKKREQYLWASGVVDVAYSCNDTLENLETVKK